ncbi:MAG TPA: ABC transporter permease [Chloroflexota bacterium]|nr:ABC transporter permease [Chloroflexota bacterium]
MKQSVGTGEAGSPAPSVAEWQDSGDAVLGPMTSGWRRGARRFAANRVALVGLVVALALLLAGIAAPLITPAAYDDTRFVANTYAFPSGAHWFGVDAVGRDFFSRNIYAIRISLAIGIGTAIISTLIGIPLGALAGFYGRKIDWTISRILEVFQIIPPFLIAILLSTLTGGGVIELILIISFTNWMNMCRLVRADMLTMREEEYVMAARAQGVGQFRIIFRHLLPNALGPILVAFSLTIPIAIGVEAGLSLLGVGVNPPTPSWGGMISEGLSYTSYYWFLELFPVLMLTITVLSLSFVGDGLRDALDPTA